eukprot:7614714-Pyramimonas_sp.AAC.1
MHRAKETPLGLRARMSSSSSRALPADMPGGWACISQGPSAKRTPQAGRRRGLAEMPNLSHSQRYIRSTAFAWHVHA